MKKFIGAILISLQLFSCVAWARGDDSAERINFMLWPTVDNYRALCNVSDLVTTAGLPNIKNICETIIDSGICRSVPPEDRLNCDKISSEPQFSVDGTVRGCIIGAIDGLTDIALFVWNTLKWAFNNAISSEVRGKTAENLNAIRAYWITEYERAYAKTSPTLSPTARRSKVIEHMMGNMSKVLVNLIVGIKDAVKKEYHKFGCLNYAAKSKRVCHLVAQIIATKRIVLASPSRAKKIIEKTRSRINKIGGKKPSSASAKDPAATRKPVEENPSSASAKDPAATRKPVEENPSSASAGFSSTGFLVAAGSLAEALLGFSSTGFLVAAGSLAEALLGFSSTGFLVAAESLAEALLKDPAATRKPVEENPSSGSAKDSPTETIRYGF